MALALRQVCKLQGASVFANLSRFSSNAAITANCNILRNVPAASSSLVKQQQMLKPLTGILSPVAMQQQSITRNISLSSPKMSGASGTHSTLWTVERAVSAGLLAILPAAIAFPSQPLDALLAVSMVMHAHWGLEAIVTDYVRPVLFGHLVTKLAHGLLLLVSVATLGGLFYFIYTDIGIGKAVRKIWAVKGQ